MPVFVFAPVWQPPTNLTISIAPKVRWQKSRQHLRTTLKKLGSGIDNNLVQNAIRPTAVGKKNWLFFGSEEAGRRNAAIYTLLQNCRMHGVEPCGYFKDVLERLPTTTSQQVTELTPLKWKQAREKALVRLAPKTAKTSPYDGSAVGGSESPSNRSVRWETGRPARKGKKADLRCQCDQTPQPTDKTLKLANLAAAVRCVRGYSTTKDDASVANLPQTLRGQLGQMYARKKVRNSYAAIKCGQKLSAPRGVGARRTATGTIG